MKFIEIIRRNYRDYDDTLRLKARLLFTFNCLIIAAQLILLVTNVFHGVLGSIAGSDAVTLVRFAVMVLLLFSVFFLAFAMYRTALGITMTVQVAASLQPLFMGTFPGYETLHLYAYFVIVNQLILLLFSPRVLALPVYALFAAGALTFASVTVYARHDPSLYSYSLGKEILAVYVVIAVFTVLTILIHRVFMRIIDQKKKVNDYLENLAFTDMVTYRLNYYGFMDALARMKEELASSRDRLVLIGFEIANFSTINNGYGVEAGNTLLRKFVERLDAVMPAGGVWGRLAGSTFIFAYRDTTIDFEHQGVLIAAAHENMHESFHIRGSSLQVSMNAVLTIYPDDARDEHQLVANIQNLLITARDGRTTGRWPVIRFNEKSYAEIRRKLRIDELVEHAIRDGEMYLCYQPKINIATGNFGGVEVLSRWKSPELGVVHPTEFIAALEKGRLIEHHTRHVLDMVRRESAEIAARSGQHFRYAVNVSPHLIHTGWIVDYLDRNDSIDPETIEFELTESVFMGDEADVIQKVQRIREKGFVLSIDDFGTGYSNLRYLHQFKVQYLKIDKEFVVKMKENEDNLEIIKAIISMARSLGIGTVAEGVEYEDQVCMLAHAGCEYVQGYYFSRPMVKEDLLEYLQKRRALPECHET